MSYRGRRGRTMAGAALPLLLLLLLVGGPSVSGAGAATAHSTLRRKNPAGDGGVFRSESGVAVRPARPGLDGRARALSISFRRAKPAWLAGFAFLRKQSAPD
jgi:hypothetical protein